MVWLATTTHAISSFTLPAVSALTHAVTTEFQLLPYWNITPRQGAYSGGLVTSAESGLERNVTPAGPARSIL